jgi:hypothetical protein
MGGGRDAMTTALTGQLGISLIVAAPLAFIVSLLLLRSYLAAVKRAMMRRSGRGQTAPAPTVVSGPAAEVSKQALVTVDVSDRESFDPGTVRLGSIVQWGRWSHLLVYGVAGIVYALVMTSIYFLANKIGFQPLRFAFVAACIVWPLVLTAWLTAVVTVRDRGLILFSYVALLAGLAGASLGGEFTPLSAIVLWAILNIAPTVTVLVFLVRRIRAVGPMVMAFMLFAVTGSQLAFNVAGTDEASIRWMAETGARAGLGGHQTFIAVALAGAIVLGLVGWLALKGLGASYRARWTSDQSIIIDALWLIFAVYEGMNLAFAGPVWFVAALAGFLLFKFVAAIGFVVLRGVRGTDDRPPQLLLLRVFSLGRRSERLFDGISRVWRHAGSIRMIAGPDLAATTVEPHEFLDFVGGRLARRFIGDQEDLERRLAETTALRDPDGRYRVNDFFCHDDSWRMVLARLAGDSDAVLMDLRGFGPSNKGCVFEVYELLARVQLSRVVLVVDATTDRSFLDETLKGGWAAAGTASVNAAVERPEMRVVTARDGGGGDVPAIVRALARASGGYAAR